MLTTEECPLTTSLTVVSFLWDGARPIYKAEHANNQQQQLKKHLTVPHRYVCVTDTPDDPEFKCETFPIWDHPKVERSSRHPLKNYVRLGIFGEPGMQITEGQILLIDLDVTIRRNIDDLITDDPLKVWKLSHRNWIQGALVLLDAGSRPEIWEAAHDQQLVNDAYSHHMGSDQSVMSYMLWDEWERGEIPYWSEEDGLYVNDFRAPWRMLFRTGSRKPWIEGIPERLTYYRESGVML